MQLDWLTDCEYPRVEAVSRDHGIPFRSNKHSKIISQPRTHVEHTTANALHPLTPCPLAIKLQCLFHPIHPTSRPRHVSPTRPLSSALPDSGLVLAPKYRLPTRVDPALVRAARQDIPSSTSTSPVQRSSPSWREPRLPARTFLSARYLPALVVRGTEQPAASQGGAHRSAVAAVEE